MAEDLILIVSIMAALGIGIGGGVLYTSRFSPASKRARELEETIEQLKTEQARYKDQVSQHFQKTANLFQDMTEQYRSLYSHLAEGAEALCSDKSRPPALDLPETPGISRAAAAVPDESDQPEEETAEPADSATPPADAGESVTKPEESEADHMMGEAPNIPEVPETDETETPKMH